MLQRVLVHSRTTHYGILMCSFAVSKARFRAAINSGYCFCLEPLDKCIHSILIITIMYTSEYDKNRLQSGHIFGGNG